MPETENTAGSIRLRNLHEIINGFNAVFGHEGKIRAYTPSNGHLFFRICYDIPTTPEKQAGWGSRIAYPNAIENTLNYAMVKIWVEHDKTKPHSRPKFTLWFDNIYCNPYIMPDYDLAVKLGEAREEYFGGYGNVLIGQENVYIPNKLLKDCIARAEKQIYTYRDMISGVSFTKPSIKTIAEYAGNITDIYAVLEMLQLEMKYRTGELPEKSDKQTPDPKIQIKMEE